MPALAELQHPQPLFPWNQRPRIFPSSVMRVLPVLVSVSASLDLVKNDTLIGAAARASGRASAVWGRAKLSCTFNPHRLPCNWIKEMRRNKRINWNKRKKEKYWKFLLPEKRQEPKHFAGSDLCENMGGGAQVNSPVPFLKPQVWCWPLRYFGWGSPAPSVSAHSQWRV